MDGLDGFYGEASPAEVSGERFQHEGVDTSLVVEPFLEAGELGDADSLRARLAGMSPDERRKFVKSVDQHGRSGLLLAAKSGSEGLVEVLLDAGANPNEADLSGVTALHYAAGARSCRMASRLLSACAEVDKQDDEGETPLMWVANPDVVQILVEARADVSARSSTGRTALMIASSKGDVSTLEALAAVSGRAGDLDLCDRNGASAYDAALNAGYSSAAEALVRLGAAASAARPCQLVQLQEALHEAARRGDAEACQEMLAAGVLVDSEIGGETALLHAAGAGAAGVIEVLLQAMADPNRPDSFLAEPPLTRALLGGCRDEVLWILLEARADPMRGDLNGRTPCDVAVAWGRSGSADLLRAAASGDVPGLATMD